MTLLHTDLRVVLLARDVLQEHAWKRIQKDAENFHDDPVWAALQDAADGITNALEEIGADLS